MSSFRRRSESRLSLVRGSPRQSTARTILPPILPDTEANEPPFYRQDYFSDAAIVTSERKLWTSRCLLAYNSPVLEKLLLGSKKLHDVDMKAKTFVDVVEFVSYLDPRVPYTVSATTAKQLLPFAEEYDMFKLRRSCEKVLQKAYEGLRKEHQPDKIPPETIEEYLTLADKYGFQKLLQMCVNDFVQAPANGITPSIVGLESISEQVKLLILEQKLTRLNTQLHRERRDRNSLDMRLGEKSTSRLWKYVGPIDHNPTPLWR